MKRGYILCEGQTEEAFVNEILAPYFENMQIYIQPIVLVTRRTTLKQYHGGVSSYSKVRDELRILCRDSDAFVTTMFDYYAMPSDTPMIDCTETDIYSRMQFIESAINEDVGQSNCFFNFMLHEFEGLLFSSLDAFTQVMDQRTGAKIQRVRDAFASPEHINNSPATAPSKRLMELIPSYSKTRTGILLAQNMGIDVMLHECKHFAQWVDKVRSL